MMGRNSPARYGFLSGALVISALSPFLFFILPSYAYTINTFRDTISNSAPNVPSNHTVEFKTSVPIPAGGFVRFSPQQNQFTIPNQNFSINNVELYIATSSVFNLRTASTTQSNVDDGVTITPGTQGNIEIALNTTVGIPAGASIRLLIGKQTANATGTDESILNPATIGTYSFTIEAGDTQTAESVKGLIAIVDTVSVGPVDTRTTDPPFRYGGAPTGTISGTTEIVQMSFRTDKFAMCRYSDASNTPYYSMTNEFGTYFWVVFTADIPVATSTQYTFYIRCIDREGHINPDDYIISFYVPEYPQGTPGDQGGGQNNGSGTGGGTGGTNNGSGSGTTGGSSPPGSSSTGGGGGGGSGSGSSSGGSGGSGGFEGAPKPYQSGDAQVIISGYAFPQSPVVVLVDGKVALKINADVTGSFSATIDAIARGVYTFGVYGIDKNGVHSSTFSTTFTVTGGRSSTLSNINVMPSIKVSPDPVDPGKEVTFTGYALPQATITIETQSDKSSVDLKSFTALSDTNGLWTYTMSTAGMSSGNYKVRAKAVQAAPASLSTNFSDYTYYGVGQKAKVPRSSDLNRDGKVNLTDFSILLYWWNTNGGNSNPPADINGDGKVNLTDFSILIFNWTG